MKQSNLLFVFSDQHRWCDMGIYGNSQVQTPNFDRFARQGVVFDHCISPSPLCVPARGSLLTGLYPLRHGALTNDLPIRQDIPSIAHVLRDNRYKTGYIGKWHLAGVPRDQFIPQGQGRLGFESWKVCNCSHNYQQAYYYDENNQRIEIEGYEPMAQTDLAIDFIKENQAQNWGLFLSWGPPHNPYHELPERYVDRYRDLDPALRQNVPEVIRATQTTQLNRQDIKHNLRGYYAHITALDEQFGRLLQTLEQTGQLEDTLIIYTSDHGDMLGSQGFTNKQLPYEESIRVPLLAYKSGLTNSMRCQQQISLVDLPVSLLDLLGLSFSSQVDGLNLSRLFTERDAAGREACYIVELVPCHQAMQRGGSEWRAIRTDRYTLARTAKDEGFVLYDHVNDPEQLENLVDDPACQFLKKQLLERLDQEIRRHDQLLPWPDLIRHYGYTEAWNKSQAYFGLPLLEA
ncbi:MAG: sulfatase [Ruminococcaceae bacterium]|jgi:arylsulfatase A-like enzyme|nr:sulfatase [Oscillospiraceae bacterium]